MKALLSCLTLSTVIWIIAPAPAWAQVDGSQAQPEAEMIEELSPFEVTTELDDGFVAATSLAGGRLKGDLRDTPAAYSVQTRDFIDALVITDLEEAIEWTVNATSIDEDGRTTIFGNGVQLSMRGVSAQDKQRNFFPLNVPYDSYNLDRYDYSRGPNAILFGNGGFGGTPVTVTKRAQTNRNFGEIGLGYGSWNYLRATVDANVKVRDNLAFRVIGLAMDSDGWRDFEFEKKKAVTLAGTWEISKKTSLLVEAEKGEFRNSRPLAALSDYFSAWDGSKTYPGLVTNATAGTTTQQRAFGVQRYGTDTTPYYLLVPELGMTQIESFSNTMATIGGGTNNVQVAGVPKLANTPVANFQGIPIWNVQNVPAWKFDNVIAGAGFEVPDTSRTISTVEPTLKQDYETYSAFLRHRIGESVFLEFAVNHASEDRRTNYLNGRGVDQLRFDLNEKLPNGQDNPMLLEPFADGQRSRGGFGNQYNGLRVAAAYDVPQNRFGKFLFNLMGGYTQQENYQQIESYRVLSSTDPRNWAYDQTVYYRYYLNGTNYSQPEATEAVYKGVTYPVKWIVDSQRPTDISETSTDFMYLQGALVGKFFRNRLHTILAVRHDDLTVSRRINDNYGDYPTDWKGDVYYFRPEAPDDYLTLPEVRPRGSNRQPTVTDGRYQDDYNPPDVELKETTYSIGGVFHVTDIFSVFVNRATGFNPSTSQLRLDGSLIPSPTSEGWDYGVRMSLADNRLNLNFSRYTSSETAQPFEISFTAALQKIAQANVVGDLSPEGINQRGMPIVPRQAFDLRDRENEGYELEVVAKLTRSWRLSGNAAWADAAQTNAFVDTRAFIAEWGDTMYQIILDSGGQFNAVTGRAEVNTTIPSEQRPDASSATGAYNTVFFTNLPNIVDGTQKLPALTEFAANLYTDYEIRSGMLKGLRLGAGVNYRGQKVINFRGGDTIQDPNQPGVPLATAALDNPEVDAYTPIYDEPYWLATATVGYQWKLQDKRTVRMQLRISNLFDEDQVVYGTVTSLLPPDGDYVNTAARVSTPTRYRWQTPRSYVLTTTLSF